MDRKKATELKAEAHVLLSEMAAAKGMKVTFGRGGFDATGLKFSIEFVETGEGGEDLRAKADFELHAAIYGLLPEHWGHEFRWHGRVYRITGLNHRSSKRPVRTLEVETGKTYMFDADGVARLLKACAYEYGKAGVDAKQGGN